MDQPPTTIPVEFLFRLEGELGARAVIDDGPQGSRAVRNVTGGRFAGPRLQGVVEVPAGDWVTRRADGSFKLDVRLTLRTDDEAVILMTYTGIGAWQDGVAAIRTAPLFETGDARYAWLNRVQAVGIGHSEGDTLVVYDVYALL